MPRFEEPPDPLFERINASISFDRRLALYDVPQPRAHARALLGLGVLDAAEHEEIDTGLAKVGEELKSGRFPFAPDDEDIHMAVERRLTEMIGPVGGKLHTGRSRNDQVATDLALFVRAHAAKAGDLLDRLLLLLTEMAEAHEGWRAPAYTNPPRAQAG